MEQQTASTDPVTIIEDTSVRPFSVGFPQEGLVDLRLPVGGQVADPRLAQQRFAAPELGAQAPQGPFGEVVIEVGDHPDDVG